jgi:hypothetical protein
LGWIKAWDAAFLQQIAERFISKLLKSLHRLTREQIERVPGLSIELNELTSAFCRLLGHEKTPLERGRGPVAHSKASPVGNITIMPQRAYLIFGDIEGTDYWAYNPATRISPWKR